jgi:hypothetical protein
MQIQLVFIQLVFIDDRLRSASVTRYCPNIALAKIGAGRVGGFHTQRT